MKRLWWWIALGLVATILGLAILAPAVVSYRREDINVKTGQARYSRYVFGVKVSDAVKDTLLSTALAGQVIDIAPIQPWHPVNTFPLGRHYSPHYFFHGALAQVHELALISEMYHPSPERQAEIARAVLTRWQTAGNDHTAMQYLAELDQGLEARQQSTGVTPVPGATADGHEPLMPAAGTPQ